MNTNSTGFLLFMVNCVLTNNFIFSKFLGCCPFLGVSGKVETAASMGLAVTFVMTIASLFTYMVNAWVLIPLQLPFMQTIAFILVIAALVQFVEMFLKKASPSLYGALGIYLPLITTNCAVLGVTISVLDEGYNFAESLVCAVGAGVGFMVAMVLFSGVRKRLEDAQPPKCFEGLPITLVAASVTSLSFMGFGGVIENIFAGH